MQSFFQSRNQGNLSQGLAGGVNREQNTMPDAMPEMQPRQDTAFSQQQSEMPPRQAGSPAVGANDITGEPTRPVGRDFVAPSASDSYFDNSIAYQGAMQQILSDNVGELVRVEFLIGTQQTVTKEGILYSVGVSYIVLYNSDEGTYIVCDLFAIKFVTFYTMNSPDSNRR